MKDNLDKSLEFTLKWEGGYVNHPNDPGGATNQGITQRTYDHWRQKQGLSTRDVKLIEEREVKSIYDTEYWGPSGAYLFSFQFALTLFDYAVNSGVSKAVKDTQIIVESPADGIFGPNTERAIRQYMDRKGEHELRARHANFIRLGSTDQYQPFLKGWMNRFWDLFEEVLKNEVRY